MVLKILLENKTYVVDIFCKITFSNSSFVLDKYKEFPHKTLIKKLMFNNIRNSDKITFDQFKNIKNHEIDAYINECLRNDSRLNILYQRIENYEDIYDRFTKSILELSYGFINELKNLESIQKSFSSFIHAFESYQVYINKIINSLDPAIEKINEFISNIKIPLIDEENKTIILQNANNFGTFGWSLPAYIELGIINESPKSFKECIDILFNDYKINDEFNSEYFNNTFVQSQGPIYRESCDCFFAGNFTACSMLLFSLIDSKLINFQKNSNLGDNLKPGEGAIKKIKVFIKKEKRIENKYFLFFEFVSLFKSLETVFQDARNFSINTEVINRNMLMHGTMQRKVTKLDCIQLFIINANISSFLSEKVTQ